MQKENATTLLKEMIHVKEIELYTAKKILKSDFALFCESIRPANLIKNSVKKMTGLSGSILDTSLGLTAGYLSRKAIVGASHNPLLKLAGSFLQFGISTIVMKNPQIIKSVGGFIWKSIFQKKEVEPKKQHE